MFTCFLIYSRGYLLDCGSENPMQRLILIVFFVPFLSTLASSCLSAQDTSDSSGYEALSSQSIKPDNSLPPSYGTAAWNMYGHDQERSGLSDGAVTSTISHLWQYIPSAATGTTMEFTAHPVANSTKVYLGWCQSSTGTLIGDTCENELNASTGAFVSGYKQTTDVNLATWQTLTSSQDVELDDGLAVGSQSTMSLTVSLDSSVAGDLWGNAMWDGANIVSSNVYQLDG
jgi:hypothetical protein